MELIYELLLSRRNGFIQGVVGFALSIILISLFVIKSSRDERGRAIIGKASIYSTIYFIAMTTIIAQYIQRVEVNFDVAANLIQFLFNTVLLLEIVAIGILRKIS